MIPQVQFWKRKGPKELVDAEYQKQNDVEYIDVSDAEEHPRWAKILAYAFAVLFWGGMACAGFWYWSHDSAQKRLRDQQAVEEKRKYSLLVGEMAARHNAVTEWQRNLPDQSRAQLLYSTDIERVLVREDARPVLFYASVEDVRLTKDGYDILFKRFLGREPEIVFLLQCTSSQAEVVVHHKPRPWEQYSIVADVKSVEKETGSSSGDEYFLARGQLVDFMNVGTYGEAFMENRTEMK